MRRLLRTGILVLAIVLLAAGVWYWLTPPDSESMAYSGKDSAALGLMLLQEDAGLYVLAVSDRSLADQAGLQPGDYILTAGDVHVTDPGMLNEQLQKGSEALQLLIWRDGRELRLTLPCR